MKKKAKTAALSAEPAEASDTIRHNILSALAAGPYSARDLSAGVGISEREVYAHIEHVRKSISHETGRHLLVIPAECKKCGCVFKKRERLSRPGKCPVCRSESIREPLFLIEKGSTKTARKTPGEGLP